jgi:CHAT domain-containing protein
VYDAATAVLMRFFYDTWEGGNGSERNPARALAVARGKLCNANRDEIGGILKKRVELPVADKPFNDPVYSDAFQCYGSW